MLYERIQVELCDKEPRDRETGSRTLNQGIWSQQKNVVSRKVEYFEGFLSEVGWEGYANVSDVMRRLRS